VALPGARSDQPADRGGAVVAGLERAGQGVEILATAPLVVADGAHTPESAARLRAALADHFPSRPTTIVLAVSNDKDIDGIAAALVPAASRLLVTTYGLARATPATGLAEAISGPAAKPRSCRMWPRHEGHWQAPARPI
jgi:folylpolyglutamate synthase/dihydropteroate synthase